jgi:hypothetical protein
MPETAQGRGRQWEDQLAELAGAEPIPGSGNGLYKLDVGGRTLLWSCKHTDNESFRVDRGMLDELRDATTGIGGVGSSVTPLLAVRFAGVHLVSVMGLMDQIALFKEDAQLIPPTKDEMRRARAAQPGILRGD